MISLDTADIGVIVALLGIVVGLIRAMSVGTNKRIDAIRDNNKAMYSRVNRCELGIAQNRVRTIQLGLVLKRELGFTSNPKPDPMKGDLWDLEQALTDLAVIMQQIEKEEET